MQAFEQSADNKLMFHWMKTVLNIVLHMEDQTIKLRNESELGMFPATHLLNDF